MTKPTENPLNANADRALRQTEAALKVAAEHTSKLAAMIPENREYADMSAMLGAYHRMVSRNGADNRRLVAARREAMAPVVTSNSRRLFAALAEIEETKLLYRAAIHRAEDYERRINLSGLSYEERTLLSRNPPKLDHDEWRSKIAALEEEVERIGAFLASGDRHYNETLLMVG